MTDNTLDAAMAYAEMEAAETSTNDWEEYDILYARALIAKLLEGMEANDAPAMVTAAPHTWQSYLFGYNAALTEIRRRAGIKGEK